MMNLSYEQSQLNNAIKTGSETSIGGDAVHMLLAKLDEGTQTVINLRSILTLKTAELNELLAQLELTNQAITNVESTTSQIEHMLREFGLSTDNAKESLLIHAEASLDSAIKSAASIYPQQLKQPLLRRPSTASTNSGSAMEGVESKRLSNARLLNTRIRYKPDTKHILRKLNDLLRDLGMDSGKFFATIGTTDDFEVLQKAYVDLDIAKTISLSAKSNMKRRNILMRSARRKNNMEEIQTLGDKIREGVALWLNYTRNTPLLIQGEDIITVLDREDVLLAKNLPIPSSRVVIDSKPNTSLTPSSSASVKQSYTHDIKRMSVESPTLSAVKTSTTVKKPHRPSAGPRLTQVKANVGLPRVRTTSITQAKEHKITTPPNSTRETIVTPSLPKPSSSGLPSSRPTYIPLPPSQPTTPTTPTSPDNSKKSMLKPQRGPGSTLRLRSMLAKRNPPSSTKPE
ncbi:uncharacterized protein B0P05DRAFT_545423 [Gilbertella persicaria]|uniref:uncharacterized protein n=1 Tax=Gilbertella persicaria TaxID=101096 RepID=UPI00221FF3F8|nr:uncharacterized protein B0P05DRAFT_545423 [Gilbertella persicaria]KAI8076675.1 hypothetical protein B0P05DRAFT_545423 [Gilbertella persicaria]